MQNAVHRWNPADYARHSKGQERWAKELFRLLALQPQESVLDIGCGDGRISADIARMVPAGNVIAVDLSREMIDHARKHYPVAKFPNLKFQQVDASALAFVSEFDVVFSSAVLHWVKDQKSVLQGIARSLRTGGRCVLQMGGKGNGVDITNAFHASFHDPHWCAQAPADLPFAFCGDDEYRGWLLEAGLVPDSVGLIQKDMVHASRETFIGWLRTTWWPYSAVVPESLRDEFLESVAERYIQDHPMDEGNRVHVRMVRLQVLAHKR